MHPAAALIWPLLGLATALNVTAYLRRWARRTDQARRRAELLLGSLPLAMVAVDAHGRVLAGNAAAEDLLGRPLLRGQAWPGAGTAFLPSAAGEVPPDPVTAALAGGSSQRTAARLKRASGAWVDLTVWAAPVRGATGMPAAVALLDLAVPPGVGGSTSAAPVAAHTAPASWVGELFDALPDPTLVISGDGCVMGINRTALDLFGFAAAGEAFRPAADYPALLHFRHPAGPPLAGHEWLPLRLLAAAGPVRGDVEASHQDLEVPVSSTERSTIMLSCRAVLRTRAGTGERYVIWAARIADGQVMAARSGGKAAGRAAPDACQQVPHAEGLGQPVRRAQQPGPFRVGPLA